MQSKINSEISDDESPSADRDIDLGRRNFVRAISMLLRNLAETSTRMFRIYKHVRTLAETSTRMFRLQACTYPGRVVYANVPHTSVCVAWPRRLRECSAYEHVRSLAETSIRECFVYKHVRNLAETSTRMFRIYKRVRTLAETST